MVSVFNKLTATLQKGVSCFLIHPVNNDFWMESLLCLVLFFLISWHRAVDPSDALRLPGVKSFVSADDVPGQNTTGPVTFDEEIFATEKVSFQEESFQIFLLEVSVAQMISVLHLSVAQPCKWNVLLLIWPLSAKFSFNLLIIYMTKLFDSDWLTAVEFF